MSEDILKQVIIDFLCLPEGDLVTQPDTNTPPAQRDGFWVGTVRRGGGMGARASTIKFLKERSIARRQVHTVTFEDEAGQPNHFVCFVTQDAQGRWHFEMGGGGAGSSGNDLPCHPRRNHPWANLAGGGWEDRFWAGGPVVDNGLNVTRVRLTGSNGQALEDTVDDGLVLFVTDQKVRVSVQVELYNRAGKLVGQHSWF